LFEEVKHTIKLDFESPLSTQDQWLQALEENTTTLQFVRTFLSFLPNETQMKLKAKYCKKLEDDNLCEGKAFKRMLVSYYDKIIDAGLKSSIINSNNKVDKKLLDFYMSDSPITEQDIQKYSEKDQNLLLNKFVYTKMNIDMLAQLVYERYTQYKPKNSSQRFIGKTDESKMDGNIMAIVNDTLKNLKEKKTDNASTATLVKAISSRVSERVKKPTDMWSPSENNQTSYTNKRKRSSTTTSSYPTTTSIHFPTYDEFDYDDDKIEDDPNKKHAAKLHTDKNKEKVRKTLDKVKMLNQNINQLVIQSNMNLKTFNEKEKKSNLYVKNSSSFIITSDQEEVSVGEGLFSEKLIQKNEFISYYNGKFMPYMVYSYGIDNEPSKGDYAIQLNSDIIYDCYEYAIKNECLASKANSAENLFAKNEESNEKVKLDYNAKIKRTYTNDVTLFVIQATKEINPGEEILTQYTMYEDEVFFEGSEDYKNDNKNNNKKIKSSNNNKNENYKDSNMVVDDRIIDLCNDDTAMESFTSFMMKSSIDQKNNSFESFQSLLKVHDFIESIDKRFPLMKSMVDNNKQKLFDKILLDVVCECRDSAEFLTRLLDYFTTLMEQFEQKKDEIFFGKLMAEINAYHRGLLFVLNDYMMGNIFNAPIEKKQNSLFTEKIHMEVEIMGLKFKNIESMFVINNEKSLFESICKDSIQQFSSSMRVNFVHIHDNNDKIITKRVKSNYDGAVDDYKKILTYVNKEDFNYSDHLSTKPTTQELLTQRKTIPHQFTVGEFVHLTNLKKKYHLKAIYELLADDEEEGQIEDIFPYSGRLAMYADDIVRFSNCGWLNNSVIDRSLAMFMQHLQACYLKNPEDIRIKQYQIFYTGLMFDIRPYEQNTKIFYDYMYQENWYKHFEDLFDKEFLVYPTNMTQEHWFLIVVFLKKKEILYYDSCGYDQLSYLDFVEKSLVDEAKARNRLDFTQTFKKSKFTQTPQQKNGYDCGVFMIMMINFLIDGIPFSELRQEDMPVYRLVLACDIIRQRMNYYTVEHEIDE